MLRVSRLADYGTVAMGYMAQRPERIHTAAVVSAAIRVTGPTVSKILKKLAGEGLLVSVRGANGGYRLARRPGMISVASVIDAVEGPFVFTECGATPCRCPQGPECVVRPGWQRINRQVRRVLEEVTLADMVRGRRGKK